MRAILRLLTSFVLLATVPIVGAACLPKSFSTWSPQNGYFYILAPLNATSTDASIVGHFWSPGSYASTGEQQCDERYWLSRYACTPSSCPWDFNGALGQMGCTSGCPANELIVTLEDKSIDGGDAFFAAARIDELPLGNPSFDFSRIGRDWPLVRIPAPQIIATTSGEIFTARFVIPDPASGFFALPGVNPAGTITAFWVYTIPGGGPRERAAWNFVGRYPYLGGATTGQAAMTCPYSGSPPFLAAAIEFDGGQVVTTYLSSGTFVDCDPYPQAAGAVRDGGPQGLFARREAGGDVTLSWGSSCNAIDSDFEIYEGAIGDWTSHRPRTCSTGGARTLTFTPPEFDAYYLAVPVSLYGQFEGSYGKGSAGTERPLGRSICRGRQIHACPP